MGIGKIGIVVIGLVPFNVYGECTPAPDCASIGYTETSCETQALKCPFDSSKLFCLPCDSSFNKTCSESYEYGNGESCGSKYKSCCDTSCVVGSFYYSDETCNTCLDTSKTPIGIVVKDKSLVMNQPIEKLWSPDHINIPDLPDITDINIAKADFSGKENTAKIVAYYGEDADTSTISAVYCYNYAPIGMEHTKNSWYMPAVGEIYNYLYKNYTKIYPAALQLGWQYLNTHSEWSSTEYNDRVVWYVLGYMDYVNAYDPEKNRIGGKTSTNTLTFCLLEI